MALTREKAQLMSASEIDRVPVLLFLSKLLAADRRQPDIAHSYLNATNGSTFAARRAGRKLATAATEIIIKTATVIATGSAALTPNSLAEIRRTAARPIGTPTAIPAITV